MSYANGPEMKSIRFDVVQLHARHLIDLEGLPRENFELSVHKASERIAVELVQHVAKVRVNHKEVIRYPASWKDAVKEALLNTWMSGDNFWVNRIPYRLLRKIMGKGVQYKAVVIEADAFFPHIEVPAHSRAGMYVHFITDERTYTPWWEGSRV